MADEDGICETCGTPDVEHSFADFLHHLYADQGMSKDGAKRVVGRIVDRLS